MTSRRMKYEDDYRIKYITPALPWWFIRDFLYEPEGAESPEELQRVINQIFRRKVEDDEMFYVHVFKVDTPNTTSYQSYTKGDVK